MDAWQNFCRRLWIPALVVMVVYVTVDTIIHLGTTYAVSTEHLYLPPAADLSSPTGYALGQRDEILPYVGMDGYHWVMQTQDMLSKGESRVRWVDYDNYHLPQPSGREVHWSSSFRWWVALLALLERSFGAVALPYAVEDVVPFANTALIVLLFILIAPSIARRFGSGITAMLALGMGAIGPVYESFSEGKSDHHGLASLTAMLTLLFLLGGAAGWVRADGAAAMPSPWRAWMPGRWTSLAGLILCGIIFSLGLWFVARGTSPALASTLLTVGIMFSLASIALWLRAVFHGKETDITPTFAEENISAPPSVKNEPPPPFAWLPMPNNIIVWGWFLGSGLAILAGLLFYYFLCDAPEIVRLLPLANGSTVASWAEKLPARSDELLPQLSAFLFLIALFDIGLVLVMVARRKPAITRDLPGGDAGNPGVRLLAWLPNRAQAKCWFIASGIAGGVGLWVSTASEAPVLAEVGFGALLATGLFARKTPEKSFFKADPSLWRVWGWSGAATSIFFYLVEYFPSHMGMRLEVNHPLYAFAWAGGGEIIFRACRWWGGGKLAEKPADWAWLGGSAFAIVIVPLIIFFFADKVFWIASWTENSRFLFIFHEDYIAEFKDMRRYLDAMYSSGSARYALGVINPLIALAVPMLIWLFRRARAFVLCALLALTLIYDIVIFLFHAYIFSQKDFPFDYYAWPMIALPLTACIYLMWLWEPWPDFPRPCKALLAISLPGGLLTMFLSLREMRWMEIGYAFWLAALAGAVLALLLHPGYRWTPARKAGITVFLAFVLLPSPLLTAMDWVRWHGTVPMSDVEVMEIVTRDVAQRLRARIGSDTGVVVSGPTTTTWMTYWGGFKGLGTLYWENLDGLKGDMAIYSADTQDKAFELVKKYGVTHIAIYSWDPFYKEYSRLSRDMHRPISDVEYMAERPLRAWLGAMMPKGAQTESDAEKEIPIIQNDFIFSLIERAKVPPWLRLIYYPMPADAALRTQYVLVYEVVPNQTPQECSVRLAQVQMIMGNFQAALNNVNEALKQDPNYLPALICGARIFNLIGSNPASIAQEGTSQADLNAVAQNYSRGFTSLVQAIQGNMGKAGSLAFDDKLELAITFVLANQVPDAKFEVEQCIKTATERDLRRLTPEQLYNFISFMHQLGMMDERPGLAAYILTILPDDKHVKFMMEEADASMQAGKMDRAAALLEGAHARMPDDLPLLVSLARFRATSHDATLRNGHEAVVLALHAHELDHGQNPEILDALACAYAEDGQYLLAETTENLALQKAKNAHNTDLATQYGVRVTLFHNKQPFHN